MSRKQDYKVTDASVFSVRPVITEHRYQMIEEILPEKGGSFPLTKFVARVAGVVLVFWVIGIALGWVH